MGTHWKCLSTAVIWPTPGNGKCAAVTQILLAAASLKNFGATLDRLLAVDVETNRYLGMLELHRQVMHQIAHEQNTLALGVEPIRGTARCVPGLQLGIDNARHWRLPGSKGLETAGRDIRRGGVLSDLEKNSLAPAGALTIA